MYWTSFSLEIYLIGRCLLLNLLLSCRTLDFEVNFCRSRRIINICIIRIIRVHYIGTEVFHVLFSDCCWIKGFLCMESALNEEISWKSYSATSTSSTDSSFYLSWIQKLCVSWVCICSISRTLLIAISWISRRPSSSAYLNYPIKKWAFCIQSINTWISSSVLLLSIFSCQWSINWYLDFLRFLNASFDL